MRKNYFKKEFDQNTYKILKKLDKYEIFAKAISKLNSTPKKLIENIDNGTVICRCEDITKSEILRALIKELKILIKLNLGQDLEWDLVKVGLVNMLLKNSCRISKL